MITIDFGCINTIRMEEEKTIPTNSDASFRVGSDFNKIQKRLTVSLLFERDSHTHTDRPFKLGCIIYISFYI